MRSFLPLVVFASAAHAASYTQLIDLPTLNGGDLTFLNSGTIDGTTGYAVLSGGGNHRVVRIDDIGGANSVSTLTSTADWNAAAGAVSGIAGVPYVSGDSLLIADIVSDQVYQIDRTTGVPSVLVDAATIGGSITFSGVNATTGNLFVYNSSADGIFRTTGSTNGWIEVLDDASLASLSGDDTPSGLAISNNILFLGQSSSVENISSFNLTLASGATLATESELLGGPDVSFSTTAFDFLNGEIYFRDGGANDAIRSIDPNNVAGGAPPVLTEAELLAGPANSDFVSSFSLFNGELAWTQTLGAGSQIPGFYAVPEPSSLLLAVFGGLGLVRRKRS